MKIDDGEAQPPVLARSHYYGEELGIWDALPFLSILAAAFNEHDSGLRAEAPPPHVQARGAMAQPYVAKANVPMLTTFLSRLFFLAQSRRKTKLISDRTTENE